MGETEVRGYLGAENDVNVEVIPHFYGSEEEKVYAGCDYFVLPSFMEGQPLALLEAMNRGICCVASSADGQLDLIRDGDNGRLFDL